ncbi:unnamed protein product [Rotaria sordida]|uniref:Transmembrane protein n=1 Tax=Rotaria sordida TaxID=392033 RepID=A0A814D5S4_9BILA|nr:unnamed protein product [Rotaria sordida]CAF0895056.1 unnamed protein product [Rotaria sordida]CAF0950725.1 unnamed protein product [Rotaria sordida]CAF3663666.1 unnamed protein product [Rotaria sordida]CAF3761887.1 unnamed protein product [Rotaria sordida]
MIFEHHHYLHFRILAISCNNISLMNTSTRITTNRMLHMNSFIILSFCILSSILLCLYAIFHNRQSISLSSIIKQKINRKSFHFDKEQLLKRKKREQNILTINDSSSTSSTVITQQTNSISWKTNSSNKSNSSF